MIIAKSFFIDLGLEFAEQPANTDVLAGQAVELTCQPPDSVPTANISWYKDHR